MGEQLEDLVMALAQKRAELAVSVKTNNSEAMDTQLRDLRDLYKTYFEVISRNRRNNVESSG